MRASFMQFKEAIKQFIEWKGIAASGSTVTGYANDLKVFCLVLKNKEIEDVTLDDIMGILSDMMDAGWQHASMMRKCMALRKMFEFMEMRGYPVISKQLIPIPRPERKLPRVATEAQYEQLLSTVPRHPRDPRHVRNRAIIRMLWDTGLRVGELCSLDIDDIDLHQYKGTVKTEKNRGSRQFRPVFWTETTNACLRCWVKRREKIALVGEKALFVCCTSYNVGQRLTKKGIGEMLRSYSKKAGLPPINAHSFRHHLGHEIIQKGGSNADVANILGHASLLSTYVYTQMGDPEVENRYRKFKS